MMESSINCNGATVNRHRLRVYAETFTYPFVTLLELAKKRLKIIKLNHVNDVTSTNANAKLRQKPLRTILALLRSLMQAETH